MNLQIKFTNMKLCKRTISVQIIKGKVVTSSAGGVVVSGVVTFGRVVATFCSVVGSGIGSGVGSGASMAGTGVGHTFSSVGLLSEQAPSK